MPDCYDIDIEVPLTPPTAAQPLLDKLNTTREAEPVCRVYFLNTSQLQYTVHRTPCCTVVAASGQLCVMGCDSAPVWRPSPWEHVRTCSLSCDTYLAWRQSSDHPQHAYMQYGTRINGLIKQINEHARRRAFLLGFSQSPVDFINGLIASQVGRTFALYTGCGAGGLTCTPVAGTTKCVAAKLAGPVHTWLWDALGQARDLRTFKSEHADVASMYAPTRSELFHGKWVEDAVLKYVRSL